MAEISKKEPTSAEAMLFFSIVKNTKNTADVDWEAVASERGFKNAEVAKVRFGQIKRKLGIASESSGAARSTPKKASAPRVAKTPRSAKGKGRSKVKKEEPRDDVEAKLEDRGESHMQMHGVKEEDDADVTSQLHEEMFAYHDGELEPFRL